MAGWNFAEVWGEIAHIVPDRDAVVCGERRVTWREFDDRAARLASHLWDAGLRPGDKVAIDLTNVPEYLETVFGALKAGCVPVNVNYRYLTDEVHYVLDNSDARAVVHAPQFADVVHSAIGGLDPDRRPSSVLETGGSYEAAIAMASPSGPWAERAPDGDDLVLLYTGGTTGMPKGVMWRNDDLYISIWQQGRPGTDPPDPIAAARAGKRTGTCLPSSPLMHGTGLFAAFVTLAGAGTVVLIEEPGLDPARIWGDVERHRVAVLTIVGDVFARPLLAALDAEPGRWDLSSLRAMTSSGVTWSPDGLLRHLPGVMLIDSLGASEALMTRNVSDASSEIKPARFVVNERLRVLDEVNGVEITPGSGEVGLLAVTGHIPLGYYKDEEKTAQTFRVVDGTRYSIPGDYATVDDDGTIRLLGRGSACINTGGEKVYPEEVELVLREHPGVLDCIVLGTPDDRYGETVVALLQAREGSTLDEADLTAWCRARISGYKRPKRFFTVGSLDRSAAGKADYKRLRAQAIDLVAESSNLRAV